MSVVDAPAAVAEQPRGRLRRELRLFEALAISVGIMAPTAAMALNGVAPAGLVGRAVPLAFLFAAIAIALVSYSFIRLTSYFNHAGSAYALVGLTVGPRAGFLAVGRCSRRTRPSSPRTSPRSACSASPSSAGSGSGTTPTGSSSRSLRRWRRGWRGSCPFGALPPITFA
jgi:amino acid transporter